MKLFFSQYSGFGLGPGYTTEAVKKLVLLNIIIFVCEVFLDISGLQQWYIYYFALNPVTVVNKFFLWQLVSYAFLHGGIWHLFFNMLGLWMFGVELESLWGKKEFYRFYFICAIGSALFNFIFNYHSVYIIGASGAIYGILLAYAFYFPDRYITLLLFFVLPVTLKVKHLVLIFGIISFFSSLSPANSGIAHLTHLGGFAVAYMYLKFIKKNISFSFSDFFENLIYSYRRRQIKKYNQKKQEYKKRVDDILDKINTCGYDKLTDEEKAFLEEASSLFKK